MKKIGVLSLVVTCIGLILWLVTAIVVLTANNFPKQLPHWLNLPAGILFLLAFGSFLLIAIAERRKIINLIKDLY